MVHGDASDVHGVPTNGGYVDHTQQDEACLQRDLFRLQVAEDQLAKDEHG